MQRVKGRGEGWMSKRERRDINNMKKRIIQTKLTILNNLLHRGPRQFNWKIRRNKTPCTSQYTHYLIKFRNKLKIIALKKKLWTRNLINISTVRANKILHTLKKLASLPSKNIIIIRTIFSVYKNFIIIFLDSSIFISMYFYS